jgi:hypothetical protein
LAVCNNVKKTITSGKLGEAALKYHTDGSFICSADTINGNYIQIYYVFFLNNFFIHINCIDNIKILVEAIN